MFQHFCQFRQPEDKEPEGMPRGRLATTLRAEPLSRRLPLADTTGSYAHRSRRMGSCRRREPPHHKCDYRQRSHTRSSHPRPSRSCRCYIRPCRLRKGNQSRQFHFRLSHARLASTLRFMSMSGPPYQDISSRTLASCGVQGIFQRLGIILATRKLSNDRIALPTWYHNTRPI